MGRLNNCCPDFKIKGSSQGCMINNKICRSQRDKMIWGEMLCHCTFKQGACIGGRLGCMSPSPVFRNCDQRVANATTRLIWASKSKTNGAGTPSGRARVRDEFGRPSGRLLALNRVFRARRRSLGTQARSWRVLLIRGWWPADVAGGWPADVAGSAGRVTVRNPLAPQSNPAASPRASVKLSRVRKNAFGGELKGQLSGTFSGTERPPALA